MTSWSPAVLMRARKWMTPLMRRSRGTTARSRKRDSESDATSSDHERRLGHVLVALTRSASGPRRQPPLPNGERTVKTAAGGWVQPAPLQSRSSASRRASSACRPCVSRDPRAGSPAGRDRVQGHRLACAVVVLDVEEVPGPQAREVDSLSEPSSSRCPGRAPSLDPASAGTASARPASAPALPSSRRRSSAPGRCWPPAASGGPVGIRGRR